MRALRFHGNKDIRVEDIPEPSPRPGWVKVKNAWAGICGSDLHEYSVGPKNVPTEPHILTGETFPTVCGHEFSGVVHELGDGVNDIRIGQKVAVFPILTDQTCHWCQQELYGICPSWGFLGYSGYGGGMAEYICVERKALHLIPDELSLEVAALVEPLAVGWHAVNVGKVKSDHHCLVVGAGPIGIALVHCLLARGVESVIVSEPSPTRAAHAQAAGAHHVLDPSKDNVPDVCFRLTAGLGVHTAFECAGIQAAFDVSLASVRGAGTIVNVAIYETSLTLRTPNILNRRSITYVGSNTYTRGEFQEVIEALVSGKCTDD
ncbi:hypothetical protein B0A52_05668 [Exophiala mesophila]|uniref:Enoyl reductase (ER) domain-containing protein n=1 Tax=Exophiala mesophila TaxID=212818 RepID=A0A438N2P5_EXOME|nr:hypothetical protein B0A52_05668 [Exophiala mesophila]